uniref:Uncharacterized protein n=1 Tax=Oryza sativa subsp. japonica TaxID=39947 RepID=Q6Z7F9_ORYSJ|nr:hypothetical protein [Oryza sativa Japonica Group]BAD15809.1 hypothetical protein [Oryza sativa Japonica Group]
MASCARPAITFSQSDAWACQQQGCNVHHQPPLLLQASDNDVVSFPTPASTPDARGHYLLLL